jgi:hypothetical protein
MQSQTLLESKQDNTFKPKGFLQFVTIQKANNRQIKIPCANEAVAKRLMDSRIIKNKLLCTDS